ncbi:MAG TPA: carboxypeptidase-like regulatory domain-containing protein [Terracidiphilus sp.]|nr:carboxypeptidase-like regulatory domain-containing protein [Terracidiphilus sp.]
MVISKVTKWITAICLVLLLHNFGFAQSVNNAQIHGMVLDQSGAAVVGAQITATQRDTGRIQTTVSGADGSFVLPGLPVGGYSLQVSAKGFRKYTQTGLVLQVGQNVQVNIPLTVGSVSQEVQVSADAAMVETQDTSISEVIDNQRIVDLPLNGRQATDLILLSGGAAMPPNAASRVVTTHDYVNSVGVSVSGGQINGNNYLLDGGDNNDSHSNINMPFPFPDALQEFNVQTNGISARYGLHPGSVINVVTKSGGNGYHGDLFEFVRTPDLNAQNRFSTAKSRDVLHRNQYGGTLGGAIVKDKVFAFGGYQETIIRNTSGSNKVFVPTQAVLNGDWSAIENGNAANGKVCIASGTRNLVNPTTKVPYAGDQIPTTSYLAPSLAYLKLIPVSTDPCGLLTFPASNPSNEYQDVGRLDWVRTPKNTIFARYFILDFANPAVYAGNLLTLVRPSLLDRSQSIVLGNQITFSPTVINSMHFTFSRLAIHRSDPPNMPSPTSVGINIYDQAPNFSYIKLSNYFTIGGGSNAPAKFVRNQYQWSDDTDWIKGKHHFSFGAENIIGQMYQTNVYESNGFFNFNGQGSGDALADYFLGSVYQFADTGQQVSNSYGKYIAAYFEDDIQLTKTLNVHGGVRWEPSLPETQQYNEGDHIDFPSFTAGTVSTVFPNAPPGVFFYGDKGIPKGFANGSYDDFAPRIGLAWDPTGQGKESIRSSYGIFFDEPETFTDSAFSLAPPWANGLTLTVPSGGFINPYQGYPGGNPFPNPFPPTKNASFNQAGTYVNLPLGLHHPYMQQWDLSLERQFGGDWAVTASYIGNKATHLRAGFEMNAPVYIAGSSTTKNEQSRRILSQINATTGAYYSTITMMNDGVNTTYNALQVSARHRMSHGYTLLYNYTYSHCLQDTETIGNKLQGNTQTNPTNMRFDYGPCDYDLRHNMNASFVYEGFNFANQKINVIAGGWSPSFLVSYNSGYPFTPMSGTDASLTGIGLDRPNAVPGVNPYVKNKTTMQWINPSAFATNGPGTFGTTGMNSLLGPHYIDSDVSIRKLFRTFREENMELRFEFFNIFNHPNLAAPVASRSSSAFGTIQAASPPRIMQLAAKYTF